MGCDYSQHEIDLYYVPSPILDCNWIIAQCRGNTWKEFEGQNKGGLESKLYIAITVINVFVTETWSLKLTIN